MANRYTRDQICIAALDMAQLANLDAHDRPAGTIITTGAFTVQWLQDAIDFWFHMAPFSATIATVSGTLSANNDKLILPSDFILDVRNGLTVQTVANDNKTFKRAVRIPLQKWINRNIAYQKATTVNFPQFYCIFGDDDTTTQYQALRLTPTQTIAVPYTLYYYQLPAVLTASLKPNFPNDYVCIEYVRIRALEWVRAYEPGTAQKFCEKVIGGMKAAGLMNEPEDDEIPFDTLVFHKGSSYGVGGGDTYAWMGPQ